MSDESSNNYQYAFSENLVMLSSLGTTGHMGLFEMNFEHTHTYTYVMNLN